MARKVPWSAWKSNLPLGLCVSADDNYVKLGTNANSMTHSNRMLPGKEIQPIRSLALLAVTLTVSSGMADIEISPTSAVASKSSVTNAVQELFSTFQAVFTGTVVHESNTEFFQVGDPYRLEFVFLKGIEDTDLSLGSGYYPSAITSLNLSIGSYHAFAAGGDLRTVNGPPAFDIFGFTVLTGTEFPDMNGEPFVAIGYEIASTNRAGLSSDALPTQLVAEDWNQVLAASIEWGFSGITFVELSAPTDLKIVPVPTPPVLFDPKFDNEAFLVSFLSESGVFYTLERRDMLSQAPWFPLSTVMGDGSLMTLTNTGFTSKSSLFRMLAEIP